MQRYKISIKREQKNEFYLPSVRNLSNFFSILDAILALNMRKARERCVISNCQMFRSFFSLRWQYLTFLLCGSWGKSISR